MHNPTFHLLSLKNELTPNTSAGEKYFMQTIPLPALASLTINSETLQLVDHHLSIYEKLIKSPTHYTARFKNGNKFFIMHVYYDENGSYIRCDVSLVDAKNQSIPASDADKNIFRSLKLLSKKFAEQHATSLLFQLSKDLREKQNEHSTKKNSMLQKLEQESLTGVETPEYAALLTDTIKTFEEHDKLFFNPDQSVKKILLKVQKTLLKRDSKQHSAKRKPVSTIDSTPELSESKHESVPIFIPENPAEQVQVTQMQQYVALYKEKKAAFSKKLDETTTLEKIAAISKELDVLEKHRADIIIQACFDDDLATVQQYLNKRNCESLPLFYLQIIFSTCVVYNRLDIFDYILKQATDPFIIYDYITPCTHSGELVHDVSSLLELAYHKKHFGFFEALLTQYNYIPDIAATADYSVLMRASSRGDNEYVDALLKAGANPNITILQNLLKTRLLSRTKISKALKEKQAEIKNIEMDHTALHFAARSGNQTGIELLLRHGACSDLRIKEGLTPFGIAVFKSTRDTPPLNEDILKLFLDHGHKIDEKQTPSETTGLMNACANQDYDAVKLFIKLGANPCEYHPKSKIMNKGTELHIPLTPLFVALLKENEKILEILLKSKIATSELAYIYEQWKIHFSALIISPTFANKYAIACYHEKNFALAETLFEQALINATDENKHSILYNLGVCYEAQGKNEEAIQAFNKCITIRENEAGKAQKFLDINRWQSLLTKATERRNDLIKATTLNKKSVIVHTGAK